MKESKIAPVAGYISIALGISGILTCRFYFGCFSICATLATIGLVFGFKSYGHTNSKVTYIGIALCSIAILLICIICIISENDTNFLRNFFDFREQ